MTKNGDVVIKTFVLKVYIHCEGCKKKVKKVLQSIEGVLNTTIDAQEQKVTVTGTVASADILVKKLIKANKFAEEWPQPQNNPQKYKEKDQAKEKDKSPPPPKQEKEKEKEKKDKDKDKDKEKKAAKDEDAEEGAKKGIGKNAGASGEGAKKSEEAEESSGAAPSEANKGGANGGAGAETSSSGGGKKKKGGKGGGGGGGGGGGEEKTVEPSLEAAEFSCYGPMPSGGAGFGHMSGVREEWQGMGGPNNRPIMQYAQYMPQTATIYENAGYQNPGYQNAGYQNPGYQNAGYYQNSDYQFNDENTAYAFNDENTGSCSVM